VARAFNPGPYQVGELVALAAALSNSSAVPRIISVRHGSFAWVAHFRQ